MTETTVINETKVLWDRTANRLYVWDKGTNSWALFFVAADCVTNAQLTAALAAKLDKAGGGITGNLTISGGLGIGGGVPDANNQIVAQMASLLFTNPSGTLNVGVNKHAVVDDARFVFQTNYSTRALFGLLGDDNFTFKVTPDGNSWFTGFTIDKASGKVDLTQGAKFEATTTYDNYVAANTWAKIAFNATTHNDWAAFSASSNRFTAPVAGYYLIGAKWRFKANSTVPASIQTKLYQNGAALDRTGVESESTVVTLKSRVTTQSILKLAANDYVEVFAFMETNDGYVNTDRSLFYGARIA